VSIEAISEEETGRRGARRCGIGGLARRSRHMRANVRSKTYHVPSWPVASNRLLCCRVSNHCTGASCSTGQYSSNVDCTEREALVRRYRQCFGQRRVFSFGRAVGLLDRRPGNRRILAPPVIPESATCVPKRDADRNRLSLTTTAGRRCLTDTLRERSTVSAIERRANPVPRQAVSRESKRHRAGHGHATLRHQRVALSN
jgi:hypothetical protein